MNIHFKFAYNTTLQLIGKGTTTASTAAIAYLIARNFSVSDYGSYIAILSYISLFYIFTDFGLNAIFVRDTGSDQNKQNKYFKNLLGLRIVVGILVAFVATAILAFTGHSPMVKLGIIVGLVLILVQSGANTALALFQSRIRYDWATIVDILGAVANLIFVYIAVLTFNNILFVILALVVGYTIRLLVALYLVRSQLMGLSLAFEVNLWKRLLLAALPIGLVAIFSQFNAQIDKQIVLLANYKPTLGLDGETAAGFYGISYKIFELAIVFPSYIMNVGFPIMVRKKEEGLANLFRFSKKLAMIMIFLGFLGLIIGWFITPFIFELPGLDKFSQSILTTRILLLGFPLFFITPLTLWLSIVLNKTKEMMFIYGFAAAFNFVANIALVSSFGYNAAAAITVITEALILGMSIWVLILKKTNPIQVLKESN